MKLRHLLPHQREAFEKFKDSDSAAFLMEMRLGKTVTSIRWVLHRIGGGLYPNVLILAPSTPLASWQEELEKEGISWTMVKGTRANRAAILKTPGWKLMQYETLIHTPEALEGWSAVILDESTAIKNPKAKVTKLCLKKLSKTPVRCILTGLIEPESLLETWSQMAFCLGGSFMGHSNFWSWQQHHFYKAGFSVYPRPGAAEAIKKAVHDQSFILTRKQAGLGSTKLYQTLKGSLKGAALKAYATAARKWEIPGEESKNSLVVSTWLRKMAGGHMPTHELQCWKYDELERLLTEDFKGKPVVVWFAFNLELARVWRRLKELGIKATWVAGEVPVAERRRRVNLLREGKREVFLCQIKCGKYGLDLSCADTEIYFSNSYSYEDRRQSEDRIEHPQKKTTLLVIDFVTVDSIDEDVMDSIAHKNINALWFVDKAMKRRTA